ncbi:MAG TPA: hypothetical protein VIR63_07370, partial [Pontiella sp.]
MLRKIKIDWADLPNTAPPEIPFPIPKSGITAPKEISPENYPDFLDQIGHVGMGGGGFRTSEKIRASTGAHTLIINGVECEPGICIDQAILLHESQWVIAGANA